MVYLIFQVVATKESIRETTEFLSPKKERDGDDTGFGGKKHFRSKLNRSMVVYKVFIIKSGCLVKPEFCSPWKLKR